MSTQILGNLLRSLDKVYRFRSAQHGAPESFELELPIQPVHDVGPEARLGAAPGMFSGWYVWATHHTHVGVGYITSTPSLKNPTIAQNGFPAVWDAAVYQPWLYRVDAAYDDAADTVDAYFWLRQGTGTIAVDSAGSASPVVDNMLFRSVANFSNGTLMPSNNFTRFMPVPMLTRPGRSVLNESLGIFKTGAAVGGTVTYDINVLFWMGVIGTPPPFGG